MKLSKSVLIKKARETPGFLIESSQGFLIDLLNDKPIWINEWQKGLVFSFDEGWALAKSLTSRGHPCYLQYRWQAKEYADNIASTNTEESQYLFVPNTSTNLINYNYKDATMQAFSQSDFDNFYNSMNLQIHELPNIGKQAFFRSYSRTIVEENGKYRKESFKEVCERTVRGLVKLGKLAQEEAHTLLEMQLQGKSFPSGRWLWVGDTEWLEIPENYSGAFNCTSTEVEDWRSFGLLMDLAMMGSGTGAVLEPRCIEKLPPIINKINLITIGKPGDAKERERHPKTYISEGGNEEDYRFNIVVGDSRQGWIESYIALFEIASDVFLSEYKNISVHVDLSRVRPAGTKLKGFGGVANPIKLPELYEKCVRILNNAVGRQLNSVECCLLIDEAAIVVVSGNLRRSAGIRQGISNDELFTNAKSNLWQQDENGNWKIDPQRDALRMANHSRVFHHKPTLEQCIESVKSQYYSGEGAIQWAGEAVVRASADLFGNEIHRKEFLYHYNLGNWQTTELIINDLYRYKYQARISDEELYDRLHRYGLNPCFTPDTMVLTKNGDYPISELIGKPVEVWDGESWQETKFKLTGEKQPVFRLTLENINSRTEYITATGNHEFVLINGTKKRLSALNPGEQLMVKKGLEFDYYRVVKSDFNGIADKVYCCNVASNHRFTLSNGLIVGNCGEIIMRNNHCNLSEIHLTMIDPCDWEDQEKAFKAGALSVAALLQRTFVEPRYARSRELDPIVGVSFTGLFYFFTKAFGLTYLEWFQQGRPETFYLTEENRDHLNINSIISIIKKFDIWGKTGISKHYTKTVFFNLKELQEISYYKHLNIATVFKKCEAAYLNYWRELAENFVWEYCDKHGLKRPNRCTTAQPAGCLDRTAVRVFDQGLLYADEIVNPNSGETTGLDLSVRKGIECNSVIANDLIPLTKITLENGRIIHATQNHKFSIGSQWVRVDEIEIGSILDNSIGEYHKKEDALLISLNSNKYTRKGRSLIKGHNNGVLSKTIVTPSTCNKSLGYLLGLIFGNGCFSENKYRVRFCHQDLEIIEKYQETIEELFGVRGSFYSDSRSSKKHEIAIGSIQLFDWFNLNGLAKKEKSKDLDRIPEPIRRSSKETILSFIAGLIDSDGCVRSSGTLSIDSASEDWIRNLQQIGEAVGLVFSIYHNNKGTNYQDKKSIWGLCLSRMLSNVTSLEYLNATSVKCQRNPIKETKYQSKKFTPYKVVSIEHNAKYDYSYDFAVGGIDDNDSWYWQGGIKSHNTKSLLTNSSSGWHPPFATGYYLRRVTFAKGDPIAKACYRYGLNVVPSQSDKDEEGNLLNDPFDPRVTEWLVETPIKTPIADIEGIEKIDTTQFSALAQLDLYMQVQKYYVRHNTSGTILFTEEEIEPLGRAIYEAIQNDEGYISVALLARYNSPFPRLPFEALTKEEFERMEQEILARRESDDFDALIADELNKSDNGNAIASDIQYDSSCDGGKCELK